MDIATSAARCILSMASATCGKELGEACCITGEGWAAADAASTASGLVCCDERRPDSADVSSRSSRSRTVMLTSATLTS